MITTARRFVSLIAAALGIFLVAVALAAVGERPVIGASTPSITRSVERVGGNGVVHTVPAGKVLILEQVYGTLFGQSTTTPIAFFGAGEPDGPPLLMLQLLATPGGDGNSYFSQQARSYFYSGDIFAGASNAYAELILTGRLVDAPQ